MTSELKVSPIPEAPSPGSESPPGMSLQALQQHRIEAQIEIARGYLVSDQMPVSQHISHCTLTWLPAHTSRMPVS